MKRRKAIQTFGIATTHILFPSILAGFITGCKNKTLDNPDYTPKFFSGQEFIYLKLLIDFVIPETNSASASSVGTHKFLDEVFALCLDPDQQIEIRNGFSGFVDNYNSDSIDEELVKTIDKKAYDGESEFSWFISVKQFTMIGYFTSEEGTTIASNYVPIPGDYRGNVPLDQDTLNFGKTYLYYYL